MSNHLYSCANMRGGARMCIIIKLETHPCLEQWYYPLSRWFKALWVVKSVKGNVGKSTEGENGQVWQQSRWQWKKSNSESGEEERKGDRHQKTREDFEVVSVLIDITRQKWIQRHWSYCYMWLLNHDILLFAAKRLLETKMLITVNLSKRNPYSYLN